MSDDKFSGLRKAVRVGYQVGTDEIRALLDAYDRQAIALDTLQQIVNKLLPKGNGQ